MYFWEGRKNEKKCIWKKKTNRWKRYWVETKINEKRKEKIDRNLKGYERKTEKEKNKEMRASVKKKSIIFFFISSCCERGWGKDVCRFEGEGKIKRNIYTGKTINRWRSYWTETKMSEKQGGKDWKRRQVQRKKKKLGKERKCREK